MNNLNSYQSGKKLDSAMKFLIIIWLNIIKPYVKKYKIQDSIENMIALHDRLKDKASKNQIKIEYEWT